MGEMVGTEKTLQKILNVTSVIAKNTTDITKMSDVKAIVRAGMAKELFDIGDQIVVTWNDGSHDYECPFDVVAFHDVVRKSDGATVPGLWLQYLTTRPPEDEMVEVAIESLKAALPEEEIVEGSGNYLAVESAEDIPLRGESLAG